MKKKVLAAITATMCCMGAISVPGIAIASTTEPLQSYDTQINYIDSFKTIVETYMNDNNISGKIYTEGFKESEKILIEVMSDSDAQLVKSFIETEGKGAFYIDFTPLGPDRGIRILAGEEGLENVRGNVSQFMEENNIIGYTYYKSTNTNIITVVCNSNEDIEHIKAYVAEKCYRAERLEYELPDFEVNPPEIAPTNLEEMRLILDDFIKQNGMNGYTTISPRKGEDKVWIILDTGKDEYYRKIELFMTLYGIDSDNVIISVETTNASTNESTVKGDTNCDGSVDMSDAVLIMQALANPNKYGIDGTAEHHLTSIGKENGDMNGDGLTVGDAQAIQEKLLGLSDDEDKQLNQNGTTDSNDLERTGALLKQFIAEQKDNGNYAFSISNVYSQEDFKDNEGSIPEPFKDKIVVEYLGHKRKEVLESVKEFMENNNISEDLVFFIELQ